MSARPARTAKRRRRTCALPALAVAAAGLASALVLCGGGTPATALPPFPPLEELTPQADGSAPASSIVMLGASPEEAGAGGGEQVWGVGARDGHSVLVRYNDGWSLGPPLPDDFTFSGASLGGVFTADGYGALLGRRAPAGAEASDALLVRAPGHPFAEAALPEGEGLLGENEHLVPGSREPLLAALQESDGEAGALVAPVNDTNEEALEEHVLHWDGHEWSREQIEVPEGLTDFRVLALAAAGPKNAWLLAQLAAHKGALALFRRVKQPGGEWKWQPVELEGGEGPEALPLTVPVNAGSAPRLTAPGTGDPPTVKTQLLAATGDGVWVAGGRADIEGAEAASALVFVRPEGEAGARAVASWCGSAPEGAAECTHALPEPLPGGYSRLIAWPALGGSEPFGRLIVTGLREGVSLRLQGVDFQRLLSLGGGVTPDDVPGAQLGAAFSDPSHGWLGRSLLPVHLSPQPAPSALTPWPLPFRSTLFAIAPQPGAPVGSLSSEALAVGANGAVARYVPAAEGKPGSWLPESLFGPGERVERGVQLRSVAWPRRQRAYAVGDEGQMWLYRGEVGLWEKDPATPPNLTANLVAVAFDPNNSARGYVVGTQAVGLGGVILRYGKTWTQETALPAQVQDAAFTSLSFAGSEAIVTYRRQPNPSRPVFTGGLLVNDGSGWRIDEQAAAMIGGGVPITAAGLSDGGAAFIAQDPGGARTIYERQIAGAPWTAVPVPAQDRGGSLSLFREGDALRAVIAGGGVGNLVIPPAIPPGFPPPLYEPIAAQGTSVETAVVMRQTAAGWSDESHELDPTKDPEGNYQGRYDMPYRPDPVQAVLIDPAGSQGWAVGGFIGPKGGPALSETADVERYPADGVAPPGQQDAPVPLSAPPGKEAEAAEREVGHVLCKGQCASFAVAGHAVCEDPCQARSRTGVGPQVWLTAALALAQRLGVRSFLYTGPSMPKGETLGAASVPFPFARELEGTAGLLAEGAQKYGVDSLVAATPQDRAARPETEGSEQDFLAGLSSFLRVQTREGEEEASGGAEHCSAAAAGCEDAYYAQREQGARVLFLDESARESNPQQLAWLTSQLKGAREAKEPVIAVGDAPLAGEGWAKPLVAALVGGEACAAGVECASASAYFYDAPDQDAQGTLAAGRGSIPEFGSGTLGYEQVQNQLKADFHGASGIVLGQVETSRRDTDTNRAPVLARLIPVIGELAVEAKGGTLLHRSRPVVFAGLARRPRAGGNAEKFTNDSETGPYIPIPEECVGQGCASGLFPEYTFRSSDTHYGDFVERNTASADPLAVEQNSKGEPIPDAHSGLFCPYNATVHADGTPFAIRVTVETGGYAASLPVSILRGSVREPCGTVPLAETRASNSQVTPAPPPPPPAPTGAAPSSAPPPVVPVPPAPAAAPPAAPQPVLKPAPFIPLAAPAAPLLAFVPPPVPTPARPSPPSGTSAVTSPIEVAQEEEEEESAPESVSNQAVAYRAPEEEPVPPYILGVVVLAAFAGATITRRIRRGDRGVRVAHATVTSARSQRRMRPPSGRR